MFGSNRERAARCHICVVSGSIMENVASEDLMVLNADSAKHCSWIVRILHGKLVDINFTNPRTKKTTHMKKFTCILVGRDPSAYVRGIVMYDFNDGNKIVELAKKFADQSMWRMTMPTVESENNTTYNPCPNKILVHLDRSKMSAVVDKEVEKQLCTCIVPLSRLKDVLELQESRYVDMAVYIESNEGSGREVVVAGYNTYVMSLDVCDASHSSAKISVWGNRCADLKVIGANVAVVLMGIAATYKNGSIQLHFREQSVVDASRSTYLETLEAACREEGNEATQRSPDSAVHASVIDFKTPAIWICAAMLEAMSGDISDGFDSAGVVTVDDGGVTPKADVLVQFMQAIVIPNRQRMKTKDQARFYMFATVRDWSGSVKCFFLEAAVFEFLGVPDRAAAEALLANECYEFPKSRFHLRGMKRGRDLLIGAVKPGEFTTVPNEATRELIEAVKVCGPCRDGAMPCSVSALRIGRCVNLQVEIEGGKGSPQVALLLLEGTGKSRLVPMGSSGSSRCVVSERCKCLLADEGIEYHITLRAWCGEEDVLTYSMGRAVVAVVYVTTLRLMDDGYEATVDYMEKIQAPDVAAVQQALRAEAGLAKARRGDISVRDVRAFANGLKRKRSLGQSYPSESH